MKSGFYKPYEEEEEDSDYLDSEDGSEDELLQEAFQSGKLKPGLIRLEEKFEKTYQNNVPGLRQALEQLKQELPWIERLDMVNNPAPLAPELAVEIEHNKRMNAKNNSDDLRRDDFAREMSLYRQAQSAVMSAVPKLQNLGLSTKRPLDYFAQMAKTDDHMQKVKRRLQAKQVGRELSEKAKKIREIRRFGKKVQTNVLLEKQKEKRDLKDNINKYKKGQLDNLDFLDGKPSKSSKSSKFSKKSSKKDMKQAKSEMSYKDKKYGNGGKKRNSKRNTKESFADTGKSGNKTGGKNKFKTGASKPTRPGKSKRSQMKARS